MGLFSLLKYSILQTIRWAAQPAPPDNSNYVEIIQKITEQELKPDENGVLILPAEFSGVTAANKVFIERNQFGNLMIAFPTWLGKGHNLRGYLFAGKPLAPNEMHQDYYGNDGIRIGPVELVIEKKIDEHWYLISRSLD